MLRFISIRKSKGLSILIAGLLLFATAVPVLTRMICSMSDHSRTSWSAMTECCPGKKGGSAPAVKAICCEFTHASSEKQDYVQYRIPSLAPVMGLPAVFIGKSVPLAFGLCPNFIDRHPPPRSVNDRLAELRTFRI